MENDTATKQIFDASTDDMLFDGMTHPDLKNPPALEKRFAEVTSMLERQYAEWQQWAAMQAKRNTDNDASLASLQAAVADIAESMRLKDRKTLSVPEAARRAGVKTATVRRWLSTGALKGTKKDGARQSRWRIGVRDLDRCLERVNNTPQ